MEKKKPLDLSDEEYLRELGKSIAVFRKKKGFSQLVLSLESGVAKSYIAELERGKRNPTVSSLRKIGKALNVELRLLLPK